MQAAHFVVEIGKSLAEPDLTKTALEIMHAAKARSCEVVLPADAVVAARFEAGAASRVCPILETPPDQMILDVGPKAVAHYTDVIGRCKTLLWNGPLGAFEIPPFDRSTVTVAKAAAQRTRAGNLVSVAGGGDTVAALGESGDTITVVNLGAGERDRRGTVRGDSVVYRVPSFRIDAIAPPRANVVAPPPS